MQKDVNMPVTGNNTVGSSLEIRTEGLEQKLIEIANTKGTDVAIQTVLMYILEGNKNNLNDALSAFYMYGDQVAHLFKEYGVSGLIKDIYNNFNTQLNDKVVGVVGVTDTNTYLFSFLTEKLPGLYSSGVIKTTPIDDIMNPNGILSVLMGELRDNKEKVIEQINNLFLVRGQVSGTSKNDISRHAAHVSSTYIDSFNENMERVSGIFKNSDINYIHAVIKEMGTVIGEGNRGSAPALPEKWTENMSYLLGSLVEGQKDGGELTKSIYEMLKNGKHLPRESSDDVIDISVVEDLKKDLTAELKEVISITLTELLTAEEDEDGDDPSVKLDAMAEKLESFGVGDIKDIKEILIGMKENPESGAGSSEITMSDEHMQVILNAIESSKTTTGESGEGSSEIKNMLQSISEQVSKHQSAASPVDEEMKENIKEIKERVISGENLATAIEKLNSKLDESESGDGEDENPAATSQEVMALGREVISSVEKATAEIKEHLTQIASEGYDEDEDEDEPNTPIESFSDNDEDEVDEVAILTGKVDRLDIRLGGVETLLKEIKDMISCEVEESKTVREKVFAELESTPVEKKGKQKKEKKKKDAPKDVDKDDEYDDRDFDGDDDVEEI